MSHFKVERCIFQTIPILSMLVTHSTSLIPLYFVCIFFWDTLYSSLLACKSKWRECKNNLIKNAGMILLARQKFWKHTLKQNYRQTDQWRKEHKHRLTALTADSVSSSVSSAGSSTLYHAVQLVGATTGGIGDSAVERLFIVLARKK